jgi:hypothetical protein
MKILVTQDTFAPSLDGPTFISANEVVDIEVDHGHGIVVAGKALYVDQKDAKGRPAHLLASDKRLEAAAEARAAAAAAAQAAAQKPETADKAEA